MNIIFICNIKKNKQNLGNIILSSKETFTDIAKRVAMHSDYCGTSILEDSLSIQSLTKGELLLKQVISEKKFVIYFNKNQCDDCIRKLIMEVENAFNNSDLNERIILLASNYSIRELMVFKKTNHIHYPIFLIEDNNSSFFCKMSQSNQPFSFVIDSTLQIGNIFFPDEKTKLYLNSRYYNNIISELNSLGTEISNPSDIIIDKTVVNLGKIKIRKKYSGSIKVTNIGNTSVDFKSISSNCSCLHVFMDTRSLMPDSSRFIHFDIIIMNKDKFSKSIVLEFPSKKDKFITMWIEGIAK